MTLGVAMRFAHVASGFLGLTLGALAMLSRKETRLHWRLGECYFVVITATCLSAALLAIIEWAKLWYFLPLAAGTYAFAIAGYASAKRRKGIWLIIHVVGLTSSYCGLAMAFLVTNARMIPVLGELPFFVRLAPLMLLSTCVVAWTGFQVWRGRLPSRRSAA